MIYVYQEEKGEILCNLFLKVAQFEQFIKKKKTNNVCALLLDMLYSHVVPRVK